MVGSAFAQTFNYDRSKSVASWTVPFTNGLIAIDSATNLVGDIWVPRKAMIVTNSAGLLALTNTATSQFIRLISSQSDNWPPGMRLVPAGTFWMGDNNFATYTNEKPRHAVYVSTFYIDELETTNQRVADIMQWAYNLGRVSVDNSKRVWSTASVGSIEPLLQCQGIGDSVAHNQVIFSGGVFSVVDGTTNNPCVAISWYGAVAMCNWRSEMEGLEQCYNLTNWTCDFTKRGYRLPTEAEWEKAARGGQSDNNYPWPSPATSGLSWVSQINTNICTYTPTGLPHPFHTSTVGYYDGIQNTPYMNTMNGYGLYDTSGNVREWCWDWYSGSWYSQPEASLPDPTGPAAGEIIQLTPSTTGPTRVDRGGSFDETEKNTRCAFRGQAYESAPDATVWYHGMRFARRP